MGCLLAVDLALEHLEDHVQLAHRDPLKALCGTLCWKQRELAQALALCAQAAVALGLRQRSSSPHQGSGGQRRRHRCRQRRDNVDVLTPAPWWTVRRAANRKPATYSCPICGHPLPALSEHMLIAPEGDTRRRRHAHTRCVLKARSRGQIVMRDEWLRSQPRAPSLWRRLLRR
jgi:hypothetical protein